MAPYTKKSRVGQRRTGKPVHQASTDSDDLAKIKESIRNFNTKPPAPKIPFEGKLDIPIYVRKELAPAERGDNCNLVTWMENQKLITQGDVFLTDRQDHLVPYGSESEGTVRTRHTQQDEKPRGFREAHGSWLPSFNPSSAIVLIRQEHF